MQDELTSLRIDDPGVRALFTEAARFQSWLDVEAALAQAQAELGVIPAAAAREITRKAHLSYLDLAAVRAGLARTGHPLVPLIWELDRVCEGDAGTLASLGELGLATQDRMAARLGMRAMPLPARTIGDHQAEYVMLLGLLVFSGSTIAREIYTLMKQEFGEVEEPVPPGTVGSSTMPQKRNPKLSQDIIAAAAQIRALVPLALEAMQTEHEADRTTSIMMSRALVRVCELAGDVLQRMIVLFDGLQVFPERMRENLDLSGGLIMGEALMLELGKRIGRQRAHDAVYDAAQASVTQSRPFHETLAEDPHVSAGLTASQVEALLDPARYTGLCRQFAERGAETARDIAAAIQRRRTERAR